MPTPVAQHDARGRGASKVAEIPTAGWKDILWRTYNEVVNDHVLLIAAGVTFYALLALVPALTALVSIYGIFADPVTLDRHMELLEGLIPSGGLDIVREQLRPLGGARADQARAGFAGGVRHRPVERELRCEVHVRGDECRLRRGRKAQLRPVDRRDHGLHPGDVCRNPAPDCAHRGAADRPAVHRSRDRRSMGGTHWRARPHGPADDRWPGRALSRRPVAAGSAVAMDHARRDHWRSSSSS